MASDQARRAQVYLDARERSMAAHPAGKGLPPEGYPSNNVLRELIAMAPVRDDQPGAAELLANLDVPELPELEEAIYSVMGELAAILVEIAGTR